MIWTVEGREIKFPNGNVIRFDFEIAQTAEVDGVLVVILEIPRGRVMTENVFGVSPEGKILWQIEPSVDNSTDPTNRYLDIILYNGPIVRILNWGGINSALDVRNGKVYDHRVVK